jgi:hypothetical protein
MRSVHHRILLPLLLLAWSLSAQLPPTLPAGGQIQLQVTQPGVDTASPVTATAMFDPPVIRAGQKTYYRVQLNAIEASIQWPDPLTVPAGLTFGSDARGQIMPLMGGTFRPITSFVHEVEAAKTGRYTITNFTVNVDGQPVTIPAASLDVVARDPVPPPVVRQILLSASATNLFLGEPFHIRALLPSSSPGQIDFLGEIEVNGDGLMPDRTTMRQSIAPVTVNGQLKQTFSCEMTVTPIATGPLKFSVQGFTTSPRAFSGTISISGADVIRTESLQYLFVISDPVTVNVRPLPEAGRLPGFTGSIGKFFSDPAMLSTNRMHVGEPAHLKLFIHAEGELTRLVPPLTPRSRDWQIIADKPPETGFTLIPLTDDAQATPEIPYSSFDPATGEYVDLTVPPIPVTVFGEGLPVQLSGTDEQGSHVPLKLSDLAATPGESVLSLKPLQLRGWFIAIQFLPMIGLFVLLRWDRHRRFLEAHPEIVRRREARRALRREKRLWRKAVVEGDAPGFVRSATNAMRIVCAPHFPANPRALVCADVLAQLDASDQTGSVGETVRKIFAVSDAQFAVAPGRPVDLLSLEAKVDTVLMKLEEKL